MGASATVSSRGQEVPPTASPCTVTDGVQRPKAGARKDDEVAKAGTREDDEVAHCITKPAFVVWEEKFANNVDLILHWARGDGLPKKVAFCPGLEGVLHARKEGIRVREALAVAKNREHIGQMQTVAQEIIASPPEPVQPGLHRLRDIKDAPCPWNWETSSGDEFRAAWESSSCTEEFRRGCDTLYVWWRFSMKV